MNRTMTRSPSWSAALVLTSGLALAALVGLLIAGNAGLILVGLFSTVIAVPLFFFAARKFSDRNGWLLVAGWVVMLVANSVQSIADVPVGYVHELFIFGLAAVIFRQVWLLIGTDRTFKVLFLLWLGYLLLSLLSSVAGRSHFFPAAWQLQYNFKWPLMFGLGLLIVWNDKTEHRLRQLIGYSWVVFVASVTLEMVAPGLHGELFGPTPDQHTNLILGQGLRHRGPFSHPGYLALTCGFLAAIAFAQHLAGGRRSWLIASAIYAALVLLSGQRQELLATVLSLLLLIVIHYKRYLYLTLMATVFALITAAVLMAMLDYVPMRETMEQSGVLASTLPYSERATLTFHGISIAQQHFPLGSGLGTYGGVGAMKFDQSLFLEQGFMRYWWFRKGMFLVDTFWPGVIAESGFIGAAFLVAMFLALWFTLVRRSMVARDSCNYALALTAVAALTMLLANSPTSGALTDPRSSFLFWLVIGMFWKLQPTSTVATKQSQFGKTARAIYDAN